MTIIAIMNGAMGFRRESENRRVFMSDKVQEIARNQRKPNIPNVERGSIFPFAKRRMESFIRSHNVSTNNLICIGKSQGAKNLADIVNTITFRSALRYKHTGFISIDMNWGPLPTNKNKKTVEISGFDYIYNIMQTGKLGGVHINSKAGALNELIVKDPEADHWNIEYNQRWFGELAFLLSKP